VGGRHSRSRPHHSLCIAISVTLFRSVTTPADGSITRADSALDTLWWAQRPPLRQFRSKSEQVGPGRVLVIVTSNISRASQRDGYVGLGNRRVFVDRPLGGQRVIICLDGPLLHVLTAG
jgi:hypothetical protein